MKNNCIGYTSISAELKSEPIWVDVHEVNNYLLAIELGIAEVRNQLAQSNHDLGAIDSIEAALEITKSLLKSP